MIFDDLKKIIQLNSNISNRPYVLNLLKEKLQDYILYFTYTHDSFKNIIFTGGTCLRKIYGLNRLSVDLDFDYTETNFSKEKFADKLKTWFQKTYQVKNIDTSIRKETVKLKIDDNSGILNMGKQVVFVSIDFSQINFKKYGVEQNLISTSEFSFFTKNFDLPTMFANKICAFLGRNFFHGKEHVSSFKARDVYDLFWLCQRSKQNQYQLKPNSDRLSEELKTENHNEIIELILDKLDELDDKQLLIQLLPFFTDKQFIENFILSYKKSLMNDIKFVL